MGLHLGWIPNEPGLRPREYAAKAPDTPDQESPWAAALRAAHASRALWTRLLIVVGLFALALFALVAVAAHRDLFLAAGAVVAVCCWLPVAEFAFARRRAAKRLRREAGERASRHAAELAEYERGKARWEIAEAERIAVAPRWLRVAGHEEAERLDVFGGTPASRRNLLTGTGQALLEQRAVIVLDLSQDQVCGGLVAAAARDGISCQDYLLPRDMSATPLLTGLTGDEIASLIVEVLHADDASATAAGRATDLMILRKITRALGDDVTMARLHEALSLLLQDDPAGGRRYGLTYDRTHDGSGGRLGGATGILTRAERDDLGGLFGGGLRHQIAGNLIRLAAVVEPLAEIAADDAVGGPPRAAARLTCLSLPDGPRDVAADLTAALIVQWITRAVTVDGGFRPAVILAGADEQSTRHLGRLTTVCERYQVPLVRMFSRLTEESARHLDSRNTAFMRLATRPEALRAAEHIGLERRFVAGRFSHNRSVSRSRTKTSTESVTHITGRAEGEAVTHTTGTTTGQSYAEAEVPRHDTNVHVHVDNRTMGAAGKGESGAGGPGAGNPRGAGAGDARDGDTRRERAAQERQAEASQPAAGAGGNGQRTSRAGNDKQDRATRDAAERGAGGKRPEDRARSGGGWLGGSSGGRGQPSSGRGGWLSGKPAVDVVKTRTWFTAQHESEAKTQSLTRTEETSHTRSESRSRTDGTSVGDEITFELVYDHKVHPETLMSLPEDQMLAPHIVAGASDAAGISGTGRRQAAPETAMVALVIDPAVVGADSVAPVAPHEIPAYEPPTPAISTNVPDYERLPRPALDAG